MPSPVVVILYDFEHLMFCLFIKVSILPLNDAVLYTINMDKLVSLVSIRDIINSVSIQYSFSEKMMKKKTDLGLQKGL